MESNRARSLIGFLLGICLVSILLMLTSCGAIYREVAAEEMEYPKCYTKADIEFRAEIARDCPKPRIVEEALTKVEFIAGVSRAVWVDYTVSYIKDEFFWVHVGNGVGVMAQGVTYTDDREIVIATNGNEVATLRHELFHAALFAMFHDADASHTDPRWELVN